MRIGILGSGAMGGTLGVLFARAGHDVVFSYSRDEHKLDALAREAGPKASVGTPREAVRHADAILIAVHWTRVNDVLKQAGSLKGKTLITCTMPMSSDDDHLAVGRTSSGAERLAEQAKGAHVVSAVRTAPSEVLESTFAQRNKTPRPDMVLCGNQKAANAIAAKLIGDVGFNPVAVGELSAARLIEPFVLLVASLAYNGQGPQLSYRFLRRRGW